MSYILHVSVLFIATVFHPCVSGVIRMKCHFYDNGDGYDMDEYYYY